MLTRFGFRLEMLYLCTSEEERAHIHGVFSSFFGQKNGVFTSEINFFTLLRKFFLGVCGFFLRNVEVFSAYIERPKVKRDLFSGPHFFVTIQVNLIQKFRTLGKSCISRANKNRDKPLEEYGGLRPGLRLSLWSYKSELLTPKAKA